MTADLRVVQWATGTVGRKALQGVIEHPALSLAGVRVYDSDKVGRDAGELCGLGTVGVHAVDGIEGVIATNADCVLYMPLVFDPQDVCRLLESGINVVTTCGQFHRPAGMNPELKKRVQAACRAGATSIHSTGSSPGFISEAIPLALTTIQRRLDRLAIEEYADLSQRNSPELLFDLMGFGRQNGPFEQFRADHLCASFAPSLHLLADSVGLPLDDVVAAGELAVTPHSTRIAAGTLAAGTVAGQRIAVTGVRNGHEFISFRATWYCVTQLDPPWDIRDTGWHIAVRGDAPLDVTLAMPVPLAQMAETAPGYTANRAVNLVPAVCAAPPGIVSTLDLPPR